MTSPAARRAPATPPDAPVDLDHLSRQTMGDRDLEREVLRLFLGQSERLLARLDDPAFDRAATAHTLLGSARGIGAHRVAAAAAALEDAVRRDASSGAPQTAALRDAVAAANRHILDILSADRPGGGREP